MSAYASAASSLGRIADSSCETLGWEDRRARTASRAAGRRLSEARLSRVIASVLIVPGG